MSAILRQQSQRDHLLGDPLDVSSLPTHLISEALARGGDVSSSIKVGGGAARVFTSGM